MSKFGPESNAWKGEQITYTAAHMRNKAARGHASEHQCILCGETAHEWAYDGADAREITDAKGRTYSADPNHYDPMCRSCHRFNDAVYRRVRKAALTPRGEGADDLASVALGQGREPVTLSRPRIVRTTVWAS